MNQFMLKVYVDSGFFEKKLSFRDSKPITCEQEVKSMKNFIIRLWPETLIITIIVWLCFLCWLKTAKMERVEDKQQTVLYLSEN